MGCWLTDWFQCGSQSITWKGNCLWSDDDFEHQTVTIGVFKSISWGFPLLKGNWSNWEWNWVTENIPQRFLLLLLFFYYSPLELLQSAWTLIVHPRSMNRSWNYLPRGGSGGQLIDYTGGRMIQEEEVLTHCAVCAVLEGPNAPAARPL